MRDGVLQLGQELLPLVASLRRLVKAVNDKGAVWRLANHRREHVPYLAFRGDVCVLVGSALEGQLKRVLAVGDELREECPDTREVIVRRLCR